MIAETASQLKGAECVDLQLLAESAGESSHLAGVGSKSFHQMGRKVDESEHANRGAGSGERRERRAQDGARAGSASSAGSARSMHMHRRSHSLSKVLKPWV